MIFTLYGKILIKFSLKAWKQTQYKVIFEFLKKAESKSLSDKKKWKMHFLPEYFSAFPFSLVKSFITLRKTEFKPYELLIRNAESSFVIRLLSSLLNPKRCKKT